MRPRFLIVASITALLSLAGKAPAQQQGQQAIPDAPQPQKKPNAKPAPPPETAAPDVPAEDAPPAKTSPGKDGNAFPEAVSRDAAAKARAAQAEDAPAPDGSPATQTPAAKPPSSSANPFPEAVSRDAAKAAGNDPAPTTVPRSDLPPGVSSSQSQGSVEGQGAEPQVADPVRAKKDTEVGGFYLKTGNFQGALQRFKDASAADPTNVAAIFGLAESQRLLGKTTEAARNYQLYLEIVPNGPKAKDSLKALKTLQARK